ncbi:bifunctional indole-3-glycerol phosphate synthase/tryptophan synthase subunit beta [Bifidobacterium animalis subsp. animalis ATCC 27672]|nr:bifunctional indole-3-glycerol phosphate synthase/tryptophan synthase subunit beta [Bifidobacterium animalis subsp. animalis ATCC 27672]
MLCAGISPCHRWKGGDHDSDVDMRSSPAFRYSDCDGKGPLSHRIPRRSMSVLDELVAGALEDKCDRERVTSLEELKARVASAPAPLDAKRWLRRPDGIPVIAEIKRASPSKGHLIDIEDPATLARQYEQGGASAISVLTEGRRFLGSLDDVDAVRAAVHIPVLRKDFITTDYQIWEARAHGADIVLLIVAALDDTQLAHLLKLTHELGMTALVETHTREEIERAIAAGARVIGINARNLKDLRVDVGKYAELASNLPEDVIKVAESGVFGAVEVEDYARAGADAVLVGEGVATADDPRLAVERLVKAGERVKASETTPLSEHHGPYWGQFGGRYVPEALITALDELQRVYDDAKDDPEFHKELATLNKRYVGRPSPLTEAPRFAERIKERTGLDARVFLKREDLNHTGAHKINNAIGQALLVKRMGKTRVIAETGAGQHGVATATVCAMLGLKCRIYMGQIDARRQALNVARMRMLGAEVVEVTLGDRILKDAINEALRDWVTNVKDTHYLLGTVAGPHPFPEMVRDFQKIIGEEAKEQLAQWYGIDHPDAICACVGGGSNAIGIMNAFLDDPRVNLYGFEAGGHGPNSGQHAIRFASGTGELGMFQGAKSYLLENSEGQTLDTYSISAGLDYASVGPEHAWLKEIGRVNYSWATDEEAMSAFKDLCETEGIIPAIESSHAVAGAYKAARDLKEKGYEHPVMIVNISGRGDKDMNTAGKWFGYLTDEQAAALEANGATGNNA